MFRRSFNVLAAFALMLAGVGIPAARANHCFAPGFHVFPITDAKVTIKLDPAFGNLTDTVSVSGPTLVQLSNPGVDGGGHEFIQSQMLTMDLQGVSTTLGPVSLTASPTIPTLGRITELNAGTCFPADSFFDVFVEAHLPMLAHNDVAVHMDSTINSIPPTGAAYHPPINNTPIVDLYAGPSGGPPTQHVGKIIHALHVPLPEFPFFSVQKGNGSGLDSAALYYELQAFGPPVPVVPAAMLGLTSGLDDIDALSDGIDPAAKSQEVRFSVAVGSKGLPGTEVESEAAATPPQAAIDEFDYNTYAPGTNKLFMPGSALGLSGGSAIPPIPSDDLDAMMADLNSVVQCSGGGSADPAGQHGPPVGCEVHPENVPKMFPLYFSLAAGSPTLTTISASPADILVVSAPFATPTIAIDHADMGLKATDDLDALCNFPNTTGIGPQTAPFYSLKKGSPSLGSQGWSSADVLAYTGPGATSVQMKTAGDLGLRAADDLDALKCDFSTTYVQ